VANTDDRPPDRPGDDDPGRGRRLGVDVGTVRIGVAASDPEGILATPVETVARDRRNKTGKHLRRLAALADELEAVEVVVGLPRTLADRSGPSALDAIELAVWPAAWPPIPSHTTRSVSSPALLRQTTTASSFSSRSRPGSVAHAIRSRMY